MSPANSFGFMDGGLDYAICEKYGWLIQKELQDFIKTTILGEIPVGLAHIVHGIETYVVSAPTMRVPMTLPKDSINVYLATMAALRILKQQFKQPITVAFPAMGTGVGQMSPATCAKQMKRAWEDHHNPLSFPATWHEASVRHHSLFSDEPRKQIGL